MEGLNKSGPERGVMPPAIAIFLSLQASKISPRFVGSSSAYLAAERDAGNGRTEVGKHQVAREVDRVAEEIERRAAEMGRSVRL